MARRVCTARLLPLLGFLAGGQLPVQAQTTHPLPVTGSFIYNAIVYNRYEPGGARGGAFRFAGRIAARVSQRTYVGLGGGSWVRQFRPNCSAYPDCHSLIVSQSEALVYQGYVQHYVLGPTGFLRAGAGMAETTTLLPRFPFVGVTRRWRPAVGAGAGADLRVAELLYLTPSFDVTVLPGADTAARELKTGFAFGLAVTLR